MAERLRQRVVTIGGGTGHYTLLRGLRAECERLTAIVSMMDSGGSSGRLRDEYGILPPGDFTRCLVALSDHPETMRELLGHRFVSFLAPFSFPNRAASVRPKCPIRSIDKIDSAINHLAGADGGPVHHIGRVINVEPCAIRSRGAQME